MGTGAVWRPGFNTADHSTSPRMESMKPGNATPTPASRLRTGAPAPEMQASISRASRRTSAACVTGADSGTFSVLRTPPAKSLSAMVTWCSATLTPTTQACSALIASSRSRRPPPTEGLAPTSTSAALSSRRRVSDDTAGWLRPVTSAICARDSGSRARRTACNTWYRVQLRDLPRPGDVP